MSNSYQNEIPKAPLNLRFDLHTGGTAKKTELPLQLVVTGDFSNSAEDRPLSERKKINVNKNNFNSAPEVKFSVPNTPAANGSEDSLQLIFCDRKDFEPEQVARQIPQMPALAMHNLLRNLKSNLLNNVTFRKGLKAILKDPALSDELRGELSALATEQA